MLDYRYSKLAAGYRRWPREAKSRRTRDEK